MKKFHYKLMLLLTALFFIVIPAYCQEKYCPGEDPEHTVLTLEDKREVRKVILANLLTKYAQNQTFPKMCQYMDEKFNKYKKKNTVPEPAQLITETLDKSRNVFDKTKSIVGNSFKRQYNPEIIESNVNKYLWLKGLCFLVLGIHDEHKIAVSYFYQPGNENIKHEFMLDIAKYTFPEVKDIPENEAWFNKMSHVMDRIAYKVFNVKNYQ